MGKIDKVISLPQQLGSNNEDSLGQTLGDQSPENPYKLDDLERTNQDALKIFEDIGSSETVNEVPYLAGEKLWRILESNNLTEKLDWREPLRKAVQLIGKNIDAMGLENALFFENPNVQIRGFKEMPVFLDFTLRLERMMDLGDRHVEEIERKLPFVEGIGFDDEGLWKVKLRTAIVIAGITEWGEKRHSEEDYITEIDPLFSYLDRSGPIQKDYFTHLNRVSKNLGREFGWFKLGTKIAAYLHDLLENRERGIFAVLMAESSEELNSVVNGNVKANEKFFKKLQSRRDEIYKDLNEFKEVIGLGDEYDLIAVLDGVTKRDMEFADRPRVLAELLEKLIVLWEKAKDTEDIEKMIEALKTIYEIVIIKLSDRSDNLQSFMANSDNFSESKKMKAKVMFDETTQFYWAFALVHKMWNVAHNFKYSLYSKERVSERKNYFALDKLLERKTDMKNQFRGDVYLRLMKKLSEKLGPEFEERYGGDKLKESYYVWFKKIGHSFKNFEASLLSEEEKDDPNYLRERAKEFRSLILTYAVNDDQMLLACLDEIFDEIFTDPLIGDWRVDEQTNTELGAIVVENGDMGMDNRPDGYGKGVWGNFNDKKEFLTALSGIPMGACFFEEPEAIGFGMAFMEFIKDGVKGINKAYRQLDKTIKDMRSANFGEDNRSYDEEEIEKFYNLTAKALGECVFSVLIKRPEMSWFDNKSNSMAVQKLYEQLDYARRLINEEYSYLAKPYEDVADHFFAIISDSKDDGEFKNEEAKFLRRRRVLERIELKDSKTGKRVSGITGVFKRMEGDEGEDKK